MSAIAINQKIYANLAGAWESGIVLDIYQGKDHSEYSPPCYCLKQPNKGCDPTGSGQCHGQTFTWYRVRLDKDGFEYDTELELLKAKSDHLSGYSLGASQQLSLWGGAA